MDPLERRELDVLEVASRPPSTNHLRLEKADDGLAQRVVVRIAYAPDRRFNPRLRQALRATYRQVLHAAVAVMHQMIGIRTSPKSLLQSIQGQVGMQ